MTGGILIGILVLFVVWSVQSYNGLVRLKHELARAWSNIDVLLKQRHDELPKLVEVCRQYQQFEVATLTRIVEARSRIARAREARDVEALGEAEGALRADLGRLFAVAEQYPELKADARYAELQQRIVALENAIADRRETYNEAVTANNIRVEQFPDTVIARLFRFDTKPPLRFSSAETRDVDLGKLFR